MKLHDIVLNEYNNFVEELICNIMVKYLDIVWLYPLDIISSSEKYLTSSHLFNVYLNEHNGKGKLGNWEEDKTKLGLDILKKGMYFPLIVSKINNSYLLIEGHHRLESLKTLCHAGIWPNDKKVCCLCLSNELIKLMKYKNKKNYGFELENVNIINEKFISQYIHPKNYIKCNYNIINDFHEKYEIEVFNILDLMETYNTILSNLSIDISYFVNKENEIYPHKGINNEYEFNKIRGKNNDKY